MPNIPGVPTLNPVDKSQQSPVIAGKPGEAISQLGEVDNGIAQTGLGLDLYIKRAQQSVDDVTFQNQAAAAVSQYQEQLAKTPNSRDIPDVTKAARDNMNSLAKEWGKSPAAVSIQMQADGLLPKLDHLGQVRGIDLMGKEWDAQTDIQMQTLLPQLVTAKRNGDEAQMQYITGYMDHIFEDGKSKGLITEADKELATNKIQIQYRQQLNESYISSADPKERQAAISQLKTGGDGPLNLSGLAAGDVAALRTQAESKNEQLDNLAESANLNRDLNIVQNAFSAPQYQNNYEARINSLQDGEWLQQNGILSDDGSPNRVMAEKLIAETNRQRAEHEKVVADNDDKVANQLAPLIDENKLSIGQLNTALDQTPNISPKVRASLVAKWRANENENFHIRNESYEITQQMKRQKSEDVSADFNLRMSQNIIPSEADILSTPGLSKGDQSTLIARADKARNEGPYASALSIVGNAYTLNKKQTPSQQNRQNAYYNATVKTLDQELAAHPGEDPSAIASKLVMPGIVRNSILNSIPYIEATPPSMWQRFTNFVDGDKTPTTTPAAATSSAPKTFRVREKATGRTGIIPASEYDEKMYEKVQ